jgi:His Kinase A (phospho-acceptor) domain
VRFDDRFSTLLAQPAAEPGAKAMLWAQLVDMVAQHGDQADEAQLVAVDARLDGLRADVPLDRRAAVARGVARSGLGMAALHLLSKDDARVAAPALLVARLDADQWTQIIPTLPQSSRALLRERRDLPQSAVALLSSYGVSDFALPPSIQADVADPAAGPTPIRELVERIEAFQRQRATVPVSETQGDPEHCLGFRFETDRDGLICWVESAPREALIGLSLAELAQPESFGVDGHAAGAFRQRSAFVDARLLVAGDSEVAGAWLISGQPLFNDEDGRFTGFRGVGKRPEAVQSDAAKSPFGSGLRSDTLRQLVHELRTPLNAMRGFGEMIAGQFLGPVSQGYRARAEDIVADSIALSGLLDDLEATARIERGDFVIEADGVTNVASLLGDVATAIGEETARRGVHVRLSASPGNSLVAVERRLCLQLIERLLSSVVSISARDEVIAARLSASAGSVEFSVSRPIRLAGRSNDDLLDPPIGADKGAHDQSSLGFGFSMRFIETLSRAVGGRLRVDLQSLSLILPQAQSNTAIVREGKETL